jgi:hypothetical protein
MPMGRSEAVVLRILLGTNVCIQNIINIYTCYLNKDFLQCKVKFIQDSGLFRVQFIQDSGLFRVQFIQDSGLFKILFIQDSGLFRVQVPKPQNYLSEDISVYVKPLKLILKKINVTTVVFICKI